MLSYLFYVDYLKIQKLKSYQGISIHCINKLFIKYIKHVLYYIMYNIVSSFFFFFHIKNFFLETFTLI